ncbi:MAG TPA: metal ABC transporter ATP-binding protein [Vicinamibacterales bacterium]|nr:metal ABC transporter ATP-binding protein [Vicinamibacterales bacterium]
MDDALQVSHLSVRLGKVVVLNDLSFAVGRGRSLAILGPNGAGKTVLFRALIGAIPYDGGVHWARGTRIGYVPQKLDLERDVPITGRDFLRARAMLAARARAERRRGALQERDATVSLVLDLVGVTRAAAEQPIGTLSGGQFQRLLIAFALAGDPNVLLLDEPTAGVDEPGQEHLNELVHRLQNEQGLTVLFISHELSVVSRYADDVLCLSRDRVCLGSPKTVLTPDLLHEMYGSPVGYHVHDK